MAATNIDPDLHPTGPDSWPEPAGTPWAQWVDDMDERGGHDDTPDNMGAPGSPWCPVTGDYTGPWQNAGGVDVVWMAARQTVRTEGVDEITAAMLAKSQGHTAETVAELAAVFRAAPVFTLDGEWQAEHDGGWSFRERRAVRGVEFHLTADQIARSYDRIEMAHAG